MPVTNEQYQEMQRRLKMKTAKQRDTVLTGEDWGMPIRHWDTDATEVSVGALPITEESKLNKTEKARLAYLRAIKVQLLRIQAITLKLAWDCRLTCDFSYLDSNGRLTLEDTKGGFWREDAKIKIKMAARIYTEFRFLVVHKEKSGWREEEIKP